MLKLSDPYFRMAAPSADPPPRFARATWAVQRTAADHFVTPTYRLPVSPVTMYATEFT